MGSESIGSGAQISEGMAAANRLREEWTERLANGATTFRKVVDLSKDHDHRALGALKLRDLLIAVQEYTEGLATEKLSHANLGPRDTIKSIRRSQASVDLFQAMLDEVPQRRRRHGSLPEDWPWQGKLATFLQPDELPESAAEAALLGGEDAVLEALLYGAEEVNGDDRYQA